MPKQKLTLKQIFDRNKANSRKSSAPRRLITLGKTSKTKRVKTPNVSERWKGVDTSIRIMEKEKRIAQTFLKEFLEFDAENEGFLYGVFGKKNCLNRTVKFEVVDHTKLPSKVRLEGDGSLRTITKMLIKHKTKNIYFFITSTRSFNFFANWIYSFVAIHPPQKMNLKIKDLEEDSLDFSDFIFVNLLKREEYKNFFYN